MPKALEQKLKKEYGADSDIPYKIMNKMGVMHGNKETEKGEKMEKKHIRDKYEHKFKTNSVARSYKEKLAKKIK